MYLLIQGNPIRKKRARGRKGQARPYDSQKEFKADFVRDAKRQIKKSEKIPKGVPVEMGFKFRMPYPKKYFRTGRFSHLLKKNAPKWPCNNSSADLDNLIKFVKDCLNGIAYHDDCQVVRYIGQPEMFYDLCPGVEVFIRELEE